jgi:hypothetical protein
MKQKLFFAGLCLSMVFMLITVIAIAGFSLYDLAALAVIVGISILIGVTAALTLEPPRRVIPAACKSEGEAHDHAH